MGKSFVNRRKEIEYLRRYLIDSGEENPVHVFTGIGGMGKTALRIAFEDHFLKPKRIPYAVLDYDADPSLHSIESTLRAIRRQLGSKKVKTPVFDLLYARYFELSMGVKLSVDNAPPELEAVASILDGLPGVGQISQIVYGLGKLGLRVKQRLEHKEWLYRIRDLEPREILTLLPEILADDLEEAHSMKNPKVLQETGSRIVILLDAFERLTESHVDDTLHRKLLLNTPHLLRVLFTRDEIMWEKKAPGTWKGNIIHYQPLETLTAPDVKLLLEKKNIRSEDFQDYLFELTEGYPFHLELSVDICKEIEKDTGRLARVDDFEGMVDAEDLTEELVKRLLRQLENDERDLMRLASIPRWFTEEILEELSSTPESVHRIFETFKRLSMFLAHPEIEGGWFITKSVRECLRHQVRRKRLWKKKNRMLVEYHRECWEESGEFYHFREFLYHSFFDKKEEAMELFREYFWKYVEEYRFGKAEGLLEAVPREILGEEEEREIEFSHIRLRVLTVRERESNSYACEVYKRLISSEKRDRMRAEYIYSLGDLLFTMGDFDNALSQYQMGIEIVTQLEGDQSQRIAQIFNSMGRIFYKKGEYPKALEYFQRALGTWLDSVGEDNPGVARSYNNIGVILSELSEYKKALYHHQKALTIRKRIYRESHPDVAESYNNIGYLFRLMGSFEKALSFFKKSRDIWVEVYGEEHPNIATSYHNLGIIFFSRGEYEKSMEYYRKSLELKQKIYGGKHPSVADSLITIGVLQWKRGDFSSAEENYGKALEILTSTYGEEHPTVAGVYYNMGIIFRDKGEYEKSLEWYRRAHSVQKSVYSDSHPQIADTVAEMAVILLRLERVDEGKKKMDEGIRILEECHLWENAATKLEVWQKELESCGRRDESERVRRDIERIRCKIGEGESDVRRRDSENGKEECDGKSET
jgi:tetratricopeptide (TPR) repeat protein